MKLSHAIGLNLSFTILFLIGCEQIQNRITDSSDVVDVPDVIDRSTVIISDRVESFGVDEYVLNTAVITGDTLSVSVSFSGGCKEHQFTLVTDGMFLESDPVQLRLSLAHDANNDPCAAFPTEEHQFDLSSIKSLYQSAYQQESGVIILVLKDTPNGGLIYEFSM